MDLGPVMEDDDDGSDEKETEVVEVKAEADGADADSAPFFSSLDFRLWSAEIKSTFSSSSASRGSSGLLL